MPLAVKGLTLGGGEGVKYVPGCILTVGGVASLGEITDLLFIHCMNRGAAFPLDRTGSCVFTHTAPGPRSVTSDRVCPAASAPAWHAHGSRERAGGP